MVISIMIEYKPDYDINFDYNRIRGDINDTKRIIFE